MSHPSACQRIAALWDDAIADFLRGEATNVRPPLDELSKAYSGRGKGRIEWGCFPEPYLGDILGSPRAAILALNPGGAVPSYQGRSGIFAKEIQRMGSYREWAKSWAYLRDPWVKNRGKNSHHESRMSFLKRWLGDDSLQPIDRIDFELFPWHSKSITGPIVPSPEIIRDFIWEPLKELRVEFIFAFGSPWLKLLDGRLPEIEVTDRLGEGGRHYKTSRKSGARTTVVKAKTPWSGWLIIEKHSGSAGPPSQKETKIIKQEFGFQ